jgi:hypothetical protein
MVSKYGKMFTSMALLCAASLLPKAAHASTIVIDPVSDGSIYTCQGCNTTPYPYYVMAAGYIIGDIDFQMPVAGGSIGEALLSVNPYGLPLWQQQLSVYGVASTSSTISIADLSSPVFIGTWNLPADLGYGQDAFFDVTSFLQTVDTPYVHFILEGPAGPSDQFSTLLENYGHPSQLTVTTPEPSSFAMLGLGLILLLACAIRLRSSGAVRSAEFSETLVS